MPPPSPNKAAHSGFETQRTRHPEVQNRGIHVAPQKSTYVLQNFLCKWQSIVKSGQSDPVHCTSKAIQGQLCKKLILTSTVFTRYVSETLIGAIFVQQSLRNLNLSFIRSTKSQKP